METRAGQEVSAGRLLVIALCVGLGIWFWDSPVLAPLKLLVVMMHETGHALAALLVGGSVKQINISPDQSGFCIASIPVGAFNQIVVSSAGYLGSAVAASLLLLGTLRLRMRRAIPILLTAWLLVMTIGYVRDLFTLVFSLGTAAALLAAARWLPDEGVDFVNLFLAAFSALYALFDLRSDLWNSEIRARSDAAILAGATYVPAIVWAVIWTVIGVLIVGVTLRFCLSSRKKPAPLPADPLAQVRGRMR